MVWHTIRRLVRHDADAADCFQRTFVSALEFLRTQEVGSWGALLKRFATARAIECIRQQRRSSHRLTTLPECGNIDDRGVQPIAAAEASELAEHLRDALADLDEQQARVFCLACLEGFSYREIAEQLGLTANHVGVLLNRAKAALRERLVPFGPAAVADNLGKEVTS